MNKEKEDLVFECDCKCSFVRFCDCESLTKNLVSVMFYSFRKGATCDLEMDCLKQALTDISKSIMNKSIIDKERVTLKTDKKSACFEIEIDRTYNLVTFTLFKGKPLGSTEVKIETFMEKISEWIK